MQSASVRTPHSLGWLMRLAYLTGDRSAATRLVDIFGSFLVLYQTFPVQGVGLVQPDVTRSP